MTPAAETAKAALDRMVRLSSQHPEPGTTIESTSWDLNTQIGEDDTVEKVNTIPTVRSVQYRPDGGAVDTLRVGDPFRGQDTTGLPEPGTVIAKNDFGPTESPLASIPPMPTDVMQMSLWLKYAFGIDGVNSSEAIQSVAGFLMVSPRLRFARGSPARVPRRRP